MTQRRNNYIYVLKSKSSCVIKISILSFSMTHEQFSLLGETVGSCKNNRYWPVTHLLICGSCEEWMLFRWETTKLLSCSSSMFANLSTMSLTRAWSGFFIRIR